MTVPRKKKPVETNIQDAFSNVLARLGFGSDNLLETTDYPLNRLTRNYSLMNSLYRSHWIVRKVIDTIPEDMLKNGYELQCQVSPESLDLFHRAERKSKTRAGLLQGLKWGRLFGGAAGIILIDGHEDYLSEPLDLDSVMPGSYKGLMILDRWSGIYPTSELIEDINDPYFGYPASYQITTETAKTMRIHHSRIIRFTGRDLPYWERLAETHWGISEVEVIFDELKKRDNTSWNIASLVFMANIRVLKMADFGEMLAMGSAQVQQKLYNTLAAQNHILSNMGMQILGKDDDFDTKQMTGFNGLASMYECFMMDIAGACEIPVTRLFGRSPTGLNATGESDDQNYEGTIEQKQEAQLRPALEKLLPVMCMSTWGQVPEDLDFTFNPYRTLDNKEMADLADRKTKSVIDTYNAGLISQRTAMKELRQMSDETGMFSNLTDEDIEAAETTITPQGEFGLGGQGFEPSAFGDMAMDEATGSNHWITIKNSEEGDGRKILLDPDGNIIGWAIPKKAQGKHITKWWKPEQKKPERARTGPKDKSLFRIIQERGGISKKSFDRDLEDLGKGGSFIFTDRSNGKSGGASLDYMYRTLVEEGVIPHNSEREMNNDDYLWHLIVKDRQGTATTIAKLNRLDSKLDEEELIALNMVKEELRNEGKTDSQIRKILRDVERSAEEEGHSEATKRGLQAGQDLIDEFEGFMMHEEDRMMRQYDF